MSIYKPKNSPYYQYDFERRGHRFHGTTKCTSRREAEAVERTEKDRAKQRLADTQAANTSLALDHVIDRYWLEVGQHHVNKDDTWTDLSRLIDYFGKDKLLSRRPAAQARRWGELAPASELGHAGSEHTGNADHRGRPQAHFPAR